ncbi:MAG: hypothetical protein ACOX2D_12725 [Fermentimonas sp.]|jgi:hypothetical protein
MKMKFMSENNIFYLDGKLTVLASQWIDFSVSTISRISINRILGVGCDGTGEAVFSCYEA